MSRLCHIHVWMNATLSKNLQHKLLGFCPKQTSLWHLSVSYHWIQKRVSPSIWFTGFWENLHTLMHHEEPKPISTDWLLMQPSGNESKCERETPFPSSVQGQSQLSRAVPVEQRCLCKHRSTTCPFGILVSVQCKRTPDICRKKKKDCKFLSSPLWRRAIW